MGRSGGPVGGTISVRWHMGSAMSATGPAQGSSGGSGLPWVLFVVAVVLAAVALVVQRVNVTRLRRQLDQLRTAKPGELHDPVAEALAGIDGRLLALEAATHEPAQASAEVPAPGPDNRPPEPDGRPEPDKPHDGRAELADENVRLREQADGLHAEADRLRRELAAKATEVEELLRPAPPADRIRPREYASAAPGRPWGERPATSATPSGDGRNVVATVHAALEPRGLIQIDGVLHPAVWAGDLPAPRQGPVLAVPDPDAPWRAFPVPPAR